MKPTSRSLSSGGTRTRSSSVGASVGDKNKDSKSTETKSGPPLRRSTRDREQSSQTHTPVGSPSFGSPKSARSRRRVRGLPTSDRAGGDEEVEDTNVDVDDLPAALTPPLSAKRTSTQEGARTASDTKSRSAARGKKQEKPLVENGTPHPELIAVQKNGNQLSVRLVVDGQFFTHSTNPKTRPVHTGKGSTKKGKATPTFLGQDGNLFYCVVCKGVGDLVCCDGCPHSVHPNCVPVGSPSRMSLENDEDPWYCPECMEKKTPVKKENDRSGGSSNRRTIKHRCQECLQKRSDLSLAPCKVCGVYIHNPPCRSPSEDPCSSSAIMCSSCRAEAALTEEELELKAKKKRRKIEEELGTSEVDPPSEDLTKGKVTRESRGMKPLEEAGKSDEMEQGDLLAKLGKSENVKSGQKRKPPPEASPGEVEQMSTKKKRKKKKNKTDAEAQLPFDEAAFSRASGSPQLGRDEGSPLSASTLQGPPTQATPAFHFYLVEQRPKIEKILSRKHRYFNRLPKGGERNALIAKETAKQWVKLSSVDQKHYIDLSMRDYQAKIIAWKEEKSIRDMLVGEVESFEEPVAHTSGEVKGPDDDVLTYEMYERLYVGTSVGSKPYKPEPNQSHNRVLLDLLRDMRFHPLPMISASRPEAEVKPLDFPPKMCIRHFDVHGPIATSIGDTCLGCERGWPHFCPCLQRRIPAIEHRSKLQPAASALLSTRVGLGVRPRLERIETVEDEVQGEGGGELLAWKDTPEAKEMKNLRFVPSASLSNPSWRADNIVEFIEEVAAMKIPEPEHPRKSESLPKKSPLARGTLPTRHKRATESETFDDGGYEPVNKCGRCRTIIMDEKGCVQCRRAQLVINMSKRTSYVSSVENQHEHELSHPNKDSMLKVQTAMLGRLITKEAIGDAQSESDKKISAAILRERWTPCFVLSPVVCIAPAPFRKSAEIEESPDNIESHIDSNTGKNVPKTSTSGNCKDTNQSALDPSTNQDEIGTELRPRNARRTTNPPESFDGQDVDRQAVAKQHREEAEELQKRTLSVACSGILLALIRRDPLLLFAQPVTAEGYSAVVKKPIDFGKIRNCVLECSYRNLGEFVADARLLCDNALIFNPPGSIYWKTAKELLDVLVIMQKRANKWMNAIRNAHASFWRKTPKKRKGELQGSLSEETSDCNEHATNDPLKTLRKSWPEAVDMYENSDWLKNLLKLDWTRTRENETAFYGSLAVRRAAKAAEVCLAPYPDTGGVYSAVVKRSHLEDEKLRNEVDSRVAEIINPVQLRDISGGREEQIVRLLRRVQSRRLERRIGSENGCARCDGIGLDKEMKAVMNADVRWGRNKKRDDADYDTRVAQSRLDLTTGLSSQKTREKIEKRRQSGVAAFDSTNDVCVSLRGSRIHGLGLFSEQFFKKGEVVAEYLGECVTLPVAEAREKIYQAMRIQDYQFRLDDSQIIDATMKGGLGRYVNHNCNPNCITKIIPGEEPNQHLRRVLILAQRDIEPREELTYDYQFPLELNLESRIPCNCQATSCRGYMNYDVPEKGAICRVNRTQKRGANMRDRIRRLQRPLKK